jgi:hypothetical protein
VSRRPPATAHDGRGGVVGALTARWRSEAAILRRRGASAQADTLESCAAELEEYEREWSLEALTLEQAVGESGYSYSALEKMVRRGELANAGEWGSPRLRRGDLPRKPTRPGLQAVGPPEIAEQVLGGRSCATR